MCDEVVFHLELHSTRLAFVRPFIRVVHLMNKQHLNAIGRESAAVAEVRRTRVMRLHVLVELAVPLTREATNGAGKRGAVLVGGFCVDLQFFLVKSREGTVIAGKPGTTTRLSFPLCSDRRHFFVKHGFTAAF